LATKPNANVLPPCEEMSLELRRSMNACAFRSLAAALFPLFLFVYACAIARADDQSDVQAAITAAETVKGYQEPGVFYSLIFIESFPYAWVSAGLGTTGDASMDYILSKATGSWKILGQGGGILGPSEMVGAGVPQATATSLEGFSCPVQLRRFGGDTKTPPPAIDKFFGRIHIIRYSASPALYRLVAAKGPGVLPAHKTFAVYKGRKIVVNIVKPLNGYACLLSIRFMDPHSG
jgi:hypothetical protein